MKPIRIDDEHNPEPVRGLPERLPKGETVIWQGSPAFLPFAVSVFRLRWIAGYFAIAAFFRGAAAAASGADAAVAATQVAIIGAAAIVLMLALAFIMQRSAIYTITNRRVVLRFGAAIRKTINVPFSFIESASIKTRANGGGDIVLSLKGPDGIGFFHLWPHARPFRFSRAEPMLRAIPKVRDVSELLTGAVKAELGEQVRLHPISAPEAPSRADAPAGAQTAAV